MEFRSILSNKLKKRKNNKIIVPFTFFHETLMATEQSITTKLLDEATTLRFKLDFIDVGGEMPCSWNHIVQWLSDCTQ